MPDRAEVISQLERCTLQTDLPIRTHGDACAICHYKRDGRCNFTSLMADALALLKEQEPVKPELYLVGEPRWKFYRCPVCKMAWYYKGNYCLNCGRPVKWDD